MFDGQGARITEAVLHEFSEGDRPVQLLPENGVGALGSVLRIDGREFGHGRTRNQGIDHTGGELVGLLTQDAVPGMEIARWVSCVLYQLFSVNIYKLEALDPMLAIP